MRFSREQVAAVTVRSVADGRIRINTAEYVAPVAVTAEEILGDWAPTPVAELLEDHFDALIATRPELILLGTGATGQFPPRELVFAMARRAIGFEVMDSAAAARTFNVLAGEGRRVAAVLYP